MGRKRAKWKLTNKAIEIIIANGGQIFGGAVRDKYLHDIHARAFYDHVKGLDPGADEFHGGKSITELYQDKTFKSDLFGRFIVPKDIDAYIHISDQSTLINALRKVFPCITALFNRDIKQYFPSLEIEENTIMHFRYALRAMNTTEIHQWLARLFSIVPGEIRNEHRTFLHELSNVSMEMLREGRRAIYLDLMVNVRANTSGSMALDPPFGNLDFFCNSLILDKHGYKLSTQVKIADPLCRFNKLCSIMKDIETKVAKVDNVVWYRVRKMMKRGWKVEGIFTHIEQIHDNAYDGHCLICHETLNELESVVYDSIPHMKLTCCDARYHPRCLLSALNTGEHSMTARQMCAMCSQPLHEIMKDSRNLAGYIDNNIHLL